MSTLHRSDLRDKATWPVALAGLAAYAVFILGVFGAGLVQNDWDHMLSELGARTVDAAWAWNLPLAVCGALIMVFGLGLARSLRPPARSTTASLLVVVFGAGLFLEGLFLPLDCQETDPGCGESVAHSWQHQAHEMETGLGLLAFLIAIVIFAVKFRRAAHWKGWWRQWALMAILTAAPYVVVAFATDNGEYAVAGIVFNTLFVWNAAVAQRLLRISRVGGSGEE